MTNLVDRLIDLAPPPEILLDRVAPSSWADLECDLGTSLPDDYKVFLTVYGSGEFNDLFFCLNPISGPEGMNLIKQARRASFDRDSFLDCYEEAKATFPEACPFPSFPAPGGLLPLGGDTNGGCAFWLTEGPPDDWPLIFYPHGFNRFQKFSMPLVEFLVRWLSGGLPDCFFGAGGHFLHRTDPVYRNFSSGS